MESEGILPIEMHADEALSLVEEIEQSRKVVEAAKHLRRAYSSAVDEDCAGTWKDWEPLDKALVAYDALEKEAGK